MAPRLWWRSLGSCGCHDRHRVCPQAALRSRREEAPVNSIWEGSGNVMCLVVVRALSREARLVEALISDLTEMSDGCAILTGELSHLVKLIRLNPEMPEPSARILSQQLVLDSSGMRV